MSTYARTIEPFPPESWCYDKIIAGSPKSRFDFEYIATFNLECWHARLGDAAGSFAGESKLLSVEIDDATLLCLCECHMNYDRDGHLDLSKPDLNKLQQQLKYVISSRKDCDEWFVRLSYRSPKDVAEGRLPVTFSDDIITALIKSERCFDDMIAHRFHQFRGMYLPQLHVHLVPWRHDCDQSREMRCFVYKRRLVAVCHQFPLEPFVFVARRDSLVSCLNSFLMSVWHAAPNLYQSSVVDVEVRERDSRLDPIIVEFNPYGYNGSTDAILFDWLIDRDVLYNEGGSDVVLRYGRTEWMAPPESREASSHLSRQLRMPVVSVVLRFTDSSDTIRSQGSKTTC